MTSKSRVNVSNSLIACAVLSAPLLAAAQDNGRKIEEVVVTAQKSEEALQDVPISMSALTGDQIDDLGITTMAEIATYTPNAKVTEDFRSIRGIGSTIDNQGSEESVSLYVDGVFQKGDYFLDAAFMDIERIEVLRGPQGTLYGRNAIAGVLAVTTKDPDGEFGGFAEVSAGEDEYRRFRGAVGGSLIEDKLNFRLAMALEDERGHIRNTHYDENPQNVEYSMGGDKLSARLKLGAPDFLGWDVIVSHTIIDNKVGGSGWQYFEGSAGLESVFRYYDEDFRFNKDYRHSIDGDERADFDATQTYIRMTRGDEWQWQVLAGYNDQEVRGGKDVDFSPAPVVFAEVKPNTAEVAQLEVQLTSPELDGLFGLNNVMGLNLGYTEFTAGVLGYQSKTYTRTDFFLDGPLFLTITGLSALADITPGLTQIVQGALLGINPEVTEQVERVVDTKAQAYSVFGQFVWHLRDDLRFIIGGRYEEERRDSKFDLEFVSTQPAIVFPIIGFNEFDEEKDFSDYAFTPKFNVIYDINDDVNIYATFAEGFKSGGINDGTTDGAADTLFYEAEEAKSYELGSKSMLFNQTLQLNAALFYSEYQNLQTSFVNADSSFVIGNAAEATIKGAELEWKWFLGEWFDVVGGIGYVHGRYDDYPNAPCTADQEETSCNLKGEPTYRLTPWTGSLTTNARFPVPGVDSAFGFVSVTANYQHDTLLNADNDPDQFQEAYTLIDARLGILAIDESWSISLIGKNLTNELYLTGASDSGLFAGDWGVVGKPRRAYLEVKYEF